MEEISKNNIDVYSYSSKKDMLELKMDIFLSSFFCKMSGINKNYNFIVQMTADLFWDFCPNRSIHEFYYLYRYMLKKGLFSVFSFKFEDISDVIFDGRCIMSGKGNCRHISSFYDDILEVIGKNYDNNIEASLLYVLLSDSKLNEMIDSGEAINYNHAVNLVGQNNNFYIQDATNNFIFSTSKILENDPYLSCRSIMKNREILLFPSTIMSYESLKEEELIYYLELMNKSEGISKQELKDIKKKLKKHCEKNYDVLYNFHKKIFPDVEKIDNKIMKLYKRDFI